MRAPIPTALLFVLLSPFVTAMDDAGLSDLQTRILSLEAMTVEGLPHPLGRFNVTYEICNLGEGPTVDGWHDLAVIATVGNTQLGGYPLQLSGDQCVVRFQYFDTPAVVGNFTVRLHASAMNEVLTTDNNSTANASKLIGPGVGVIAPGGVISQGFYDGFWAGIGGIIDRFDDRTAYAIAYTTEEIVCQGIGNQLVCEQIHGDYGATTLRACRGPPAAPNVLAGLVYTIFHPHDPHVSPPIDPYLPKVDTGLRPCSAPSPMQLAYDAAGFADQMAGRTP